jgi:hypothetical protein
MASAKSRPEPDRTPLGQRRVRTRDPAPTTLQDLQDAALEEWDRILQETITTLIRSMRERLEAVIRARGVTLGFRLSLGYLNNCIFVWEIISTATEFFMGHVIKLLFL